MKISILSPNLSSNGLARAHVLARMLQREHEVEIIGPILGRGIWEPAAEDTTMTYKTVDASCWPATYWKLNRLQKLITGDVIYASKPLRTSLGVGLASRARTGRPLVLDIDDWEMGFLTERLSNSGFPGRVAFELASAVLIYRPGSSWNVRHTEKMIGAADDITVSNSFLQHRYGGVIIRHARDPKALNPRAFDRDALRDRYRIDRDHNVIVFLGTPLAYKGIEDLIEAVSLIGRGDILLMIVGMDYRKPYCRRIASIASRCLGDRFIPFGLQPFARLPEFLALADVFVLPQRRTDATVGQLPAKLFDAMAMAMPIVATEVGDMPSILEECGLTIEPGRPALLATAIECIFEDYGEAKKMGEKARTKFIARYTYDAVGDDLLHLFKEYC